MSIEHLVRMVNDISDYFRSEPDRSAAIAGVSNHLKKYWDPRMRRQIIAHLGEHGGEGLSELGQASVAKLRELDAAQSAG
ncbi:MAG: formate dehydrogenase subunit delta [Rudaea sp.]|nr:formate dehydrogenase subunit delta [Rudaea sp.]